MSESCYCWIHPSPVSWFLLEKSTFCCTGAAQLGHHAASPSGTECLEQSHVPGGNFSTVHISQHSRNLLVCYSVWIPQIFLMSVGDEEPLQTQPLSLKFPEFAPKVWPWLSLWSLLLLHVHTSTPVLHNSLTKGLLHLFKAVGENLRSHFKNKAMTQLNLIFKSVPRGL